MSTVIKRGFFSALFLGSFFSLFAQNNENNTEALFEDLIVVPMRLPALQEIGGSPFLTPEYKFAKVEIPSGKSVSNVPVKFNILSNAMMIQKEGRDMKLDAFKTVVYTEYQTDGSEKQIIFKNGYPAVDKQTEKSIYQVLSTGATVELIKFMSQKVEDAATLGDYSRREIVTSEQYYLYTKNGTIKRIKGKKDFTETLPELSAKISEIITTNSLKLKSEADITLLVEALNKP